MGQNVSTTGAKKLSIDIPNQGTLTGYTLKDPATGKESLHRFAKIPYANPTVGDQRFCLPTSLGPDFDYTGEYAECGDKCPQPVFDSKYFQYPEAPIDEKIQYLNVYMPLSDKHKPEGGWPVLVYIHGGWLQYGDPNNRYYNMMELMSNKDHFTQKFIFVTIGYRLNMFGFLTCKELLQEDPTLLNQGFWDQRLAIEWTYRYIKYFGGNPDKITLGGLSAGSYSTFFQLAYEVYHPETEQIIKQACFFSNMILTQPKTVSECQTQFEEIVSVLGISDQTASEKIKALRDLTIQQISYDLIPKLKLHTFRAVTDDIFVSASLLSDIKSGVFGRKLADKGVRILHGETDNEGFLYSLLDTPQTIEQLATEIENYYPRTVVSTLFELYDVDNIDPTPADFNERLMKLYGDIIGDGQVFCSTRGFANYVIAAGFPTKDYYRYRISFRGKWLDQHLPLQFKIPHAYDSPVWFYSLSLGFTQDEAECLRHWLMPYLKFLNFEKDIPEWPTESIKKLRYFDKKGQISYVEDENWHWGLKFANAVYDVQLKK